MEFNRRMRSTILDVCYGIFLNRYRMGLFECGKSVKSYCTHRTFFRGDMRFMDRSYIHPAYFLISSNDLRNE